MEYLNLNEPVNNFKDPKDLGVCEHEWNFLVTSMKDGSLFVETCKKCNMSINTFELFKD